MEVRSSLIDRALRGGMRPDLAAIPPSKDGYSERLLEPLKDGCLVDCWGAGKSTAEMSATMAPWLAATGTSLAAGGLLFAGLVPAMPVAETILGFLGMTFGMVGAASLVGAVAGAGAYVATSAVVHSMLRHRREQAAEKVLTGPIPTPEQRAATVRAALEGPGSLAGGLLGMVLGPFVTGPAMSAFPYQIMRRDKPGEVLSATAGFPFMATVGMGFGMAFSPLTGFLLGRVEGVRPQLATAAGVAAGVGLAVGVGLLTGAHPALTVAAAWLGGCFGGSLASAAKAPLDDPDVRQVRRWQAEMGGAELHQNLIRLATGEDLTPEQVADANRLLTGLDKKERGLLLESVAYDPQVGVTMQQWAKAHQANPELARLEPWKKLVDLGAPRVGDSLRALCQVPEARSLVRDLSDKDRKKLVEHLASTWQDEPTTRQQVAEIARSHVLGSGELKLTNPPTRLVHETESHVRVGGVNIRRKPLSGS